MGWTNEYNRLIGLSAVAKPTPKEDEILMKLYAVALNRADSLQRKGACPSPKGRPEWMGIEVSDVVEAMGGNAAKAHDILERVENIGKVVLRIVS